jgi:hypothetical protein
MATAYPTALDSPVSIDGLFDHLDDVPHDALHEDTLAAAIAAQTKLGTGSSTPDTDKLLLGTGSGASAWSDPSAARTALGLVIGTDVQAFADVPSFDGIAFPATQVPHAGANVLDDYEEGTWTPVLTFGTPGDLSVAYTTQIGRYTKVGRLVHWSCIILTSTFTHTTASGNLLVTGLPFTAATLSGMVWSTACSLRYDKAGWTQISATVSSASSSLFFIGNGSGVAQSAIAFGDMPTGTTVTLRASGFYETA